MNNGKKSIVECCARLWAKVVSVFGVGTHEPKSVLVTRNVLLYGRSVNLIRVLMC